jgi:5-methylthioadenosine/S-adenosylhomocysteine deaminase
VSPGRRVAIRAGWVVGFDGRGHRLLRDGTVVLEGDQIVHVGPANDPLSPVAETIEARDGVLTPGLISTHGHLSSSLLDRSFLEDRGSPQFCPSTPTSPLTYPGWEPGR